MPLVSVLEFFAFLLLAIILAPFALAAIAAVVFAVGLVVVVIWGIFGALFGK